jgi:O-antigen/teichoic acid export membrane protein
MLGGMGRFLMATVAVIVGLFVAGAIAVWLFNALLGAAFYLIVGAAVVGGAVWLYGRAKRGLGSGRNQRRLEATLATWRQRNR